MKKEREYFMECRDSKQSKAQRYVFFAEKKAAQVEGIKSGATSIPVQSAAVIGAGTMGIGIVQCFANAGIAVTLNDLQDSQLEKAKGQISLTYQSAVSKGRLDQDSADRALACIRTSSGYEAMANADIVIEAVFEDLALKQEIFTRLDAMCKPETILATNTSSLDINEIARACKRPGKVIGTHFFSPANIMRLLENVRGEMTSDETITTVMQLAKTLKKIPVLVEVCDGFVGNRMLYAYSRQANALLEQGALPQQVDRVLYDFGFAMGPFAVGDLAGLDVGWRVRQHRQHLIPGYRSIAPIADLICEQGRYGQKTGAGWYRYENGSRQAIADPAIESLIKEWSAKQGIERRDFSDEEILHRCLFALINEGAYILQEGIAQRASDIDVVWLNGYGFPLYRGGPMFYADEIGLQTVINGLKAMGEEDATLAPPCPLLGSILEQGNRLSEVSNK